MYAIFFSLAHRYPHFLVVHAANVYDSLLIKMKTFSTINKKIISRARIFLISVKGVQKRVTRPREKDEAKHTAKEETKAG